MSISIQILHAKRSSSCLIYYFLIILVKPEEAFADYKNKKGESVFQPEKKSDDELLAELGIFYFL